MKILLDECVTKKLKNAFPADEIWTVSTMQWNGLRNGKLMSQAVNKQFDILITIDKNLKFQQNIESYDLVVVIFDSPTSKAEDLLKFISVFEKRKASFVKGNAYVIPFSETFA